MSPAIPPDLSVSSAEVKAARARTRQQLGSDLESKATDEFCVAFSQPATAFGAEAEHLPVAEAPAVLEFVDDGAAAEGLPEDALPALTDALRDSLPALEAVELSAGAALTALLRASTVTAAREGFFKRTGLIRDELERSTSALTRARPEPLRSVDPERPFVQICWLNNTVRTADPRSLTNVAADPAVARIDVPRRLEEDQLALDVTLTAAATVRDVSGLSGHGVTVGVIDSEVALRHPAFQDRVIHRRNFTTEPWGVPGRHGTAVAGIIGARHRDYTGVAPDVTLYNYKVLGTNLAFNAADFDGALAIQQALEDGVRVVNCSWGAGPAGNGTSREARACDQAWRHGLTIVKSAGNLGPGRSTLTTPADAEGVIVVGATDEAGRSVQSYSSRGPTADGRPRPHLVAPGGVRFVGIDGVLATGGLGGIGWGTSFAAPHVAGLLALLLERQPELSPRVQRDRLLGACQLLGRVAKNTQGAGLIVPGRLLPSG